MPDGGVKTRPSGAPKQPPPEKRRLSHRVTIAGAIIGGLVATFLIGWAGWGIHAATHPAKKVRVELVFTGAVSLVGNGGSSGCVKPANGGKAVCASFATTPGTPSITVGDKVNVAEEWTPVDGGGSQHLLLIYSSQAS